MPLYLRIADELYLKRLVVGGLERVYEIGHDFRNEGIDRTHNPEFTMLEFYQAYADYNGMMELVEQLMERVADTVRTVPEVAANVPAFERPFRRVEWFPSLNTAAGTDVADLDDASLRALATRVGVEKIESMSRPKLLDEMFQALVEPKLVKPTFVVDYPVELSPLAKPKRGNPKLTERFELFANGKEMANAFSELNDPLDQRRRLEAQARSACKQHGGCDVPGDSRPAQRALGRHVQDAHHHHLEDDGARTRAVQEGRFRPRVCCCH